EPLLLPEAIVAGERGVVSFLAYGVCGFLCFFGCVFELGEQQECEVVEAAYGFVSYGGFDVSDAVCGCFGFEGGGWFLVEGGVDCFWCVVAQSNALTPFSLRQINKHLRIQNIKIAVAM